MQSCSLTLSPNNISQGYVASIITWDAKLLDAALSTKKPVPPGYDFGVSILSELVLSPLQDSGLIV